MKLHQLSVFLENRPGRLAEPCRLLADARINILTLSLADTQQFGILRILCHEWEKARDVLQKAGMVVKSTEVLAVEVPDRPGGLADILDVLDQAGVSVEYMYAFAEKVGDKAVLVFRFDDPDKAILALGRSQVTIYGTLELFERRDRA